MNLIIALTTLMSLTLAEELKFSYTLEGGLTQCFMNNLIEGSRAMVNVKTMDNSKIMMMINDPRGKEIDRKLEGPKMKSEFDVMNEGSHQFCFQNTKKYAETFELHIKTGEFSKSRTQKIT
jgi:hypothetical protein